MTHFAGKVVIVTGAGHGIGRAEAHAFAELGAKVVVNDVGGARDGRGADPQAAEIVAAELRDGGGDAIACAASVADLDGAEAIVWAARAKYGRVDVLVNNAGILRDRTLLNMSVAEWDAVLDVHLKGSFLMTRAFARAVKTQVPAGPTAIVNTTSVSGLVGSFGQANYAAAKAGVFGLTRSSSIELEKLGCRVNAVSPTAITRMTEDLVALLGTTVEEAGPQHVAPVVTWLASDLARDVNGRVFGVRGPRVFEYRMCRSTGLDAPPGGWTAELLAENLAGLQWTATA